MKKPEIKVVQHKRTKKCPRKITLTIFYDNKKKKAKMDCKPDAPTPVIQNILRSTLAVLDKAYPPENTIPSYIA